LLESVAVPPVGAVVFQWHTRLKYIMELPIAYVYGALLIEKRAFQRLSEPDRLVVREIFEALYQKFDADGAANTQKAMSALLESGLETVAPNEGEEPQWKQCVVATHEEQAAKGVLDPELLEQMQELLRQYRQRESSGVGRP
jgi:TRAP-type C4-dicarboxylate transport system substrate-binding protein